jgi:hypothetical protein
MLTMPPEEAAFLRSRYGTARIILEYGSGGSTWLAASLPGKYVVSVESDRRWALSMQDRIDGAGLPSPAVIWHVDIGPTGLWGRPVDDRAWSRFHRYPLAVWDQPFLPDHPDLILIDGRFRPACLVAACLRITRPVTVLFDDYMDRPRYHGVERIVRPERSVGRMAVFEIEPGLVQPHQWTELFDLFNQTSFVAAPES